jgi:hypothetical protein
MKRAVIIVAALAVVLTGVVLLLRGRRSHASHSGHVETTTVAGGVGRPTPVHRDHPRLGLLPDGAAGRRTVAGVRALFSNDERFRSCFVPVVKQAEVALAEPDSGGDGSASPHLFAACWVATGDERFAVAAIARLLRCTITATYSSDYYSNVWQFALAYDWLYGHPGMTDEARDRIEDRIASALREELIELDGNYPAMWHGRNQLANNTLVAALALSRHPQAAELQRRAVAHFAEAIRALAMTEGWPEGPLYWIQNRAFPYALAADCFMTATGRDAIDGTSIREAIRQIAYWQLYATRPDGTLVRSGDCWPVGPARGRGLWQPVQDYYARLGDDPGLVAAADYFRKLSKTQHYHGAHAWAAVLTYDPHLPMPSGYDPARPEVHLNAKLPRGRVFGRHSLGQAFLIDRWGDAEATWISFRAGDVIAHHGHYDQGSFTIYRGSPLAVHSGYYGDYFGDFRLGYYIQTIAANSLLVQAPGEFSSFARQRGHFDRITGGQRVIMPTGCGITSVSDWLRNQHSGMHYEAGDILSFESSTAGFDYVAADITAAYNSTRYSEPGNSAKVSSVVRKVAHLRASNALVVFDRVLTTDPSYSCRWLLHTPAKPQTETEVLLEGESADDGILRTPDRRSQTSYGKGTLLHQVLLPAGARILKIGGPGYRHHVSIDGKGTRLGSRRPRTDLPPDHGLWRTEVIDTASARDHSFLNILWPALTGEAHRQPAHLLAAESPATAVAVAEWVVVLASEGSFESSVAYEAPEGTTRHLVVDLPPRSMWQLQSPSSTQQLLASDEGVLSFEAGAGKTRLSVVPPRGGRGHQ